MSKHKKTIENIFFNVAIFALCAFMIVSDILSIPYANDPLRNAWISQTVQQLCGFIAVLLVMRRLNIRLFGKPQNWLFVIPCLIVSIDNFPFWSYFSGNMQLVRTEALDFLLFGIYCFAVGLFEEGVFRGLLFAVLAGVFSKNKKGLIKTYLVSSIVFGFAHLFNLFVGAGIGATLLQVCYTTLTGGLFAFAFIKTKNILIPALLHAIYNFCGLILSEQGLGNGIVFDVGTIVIMTVVSIAIAVFVLYHLLKYKEIERVILYKCLGIGENP